MSPQPAPVRPGRSPSSLGVRAALRRSSLRSRLAVNQTTTYHLALPDELALLAELGVESIGLWRTKLSSYSDDVVVDLLQESGLRVTSLGWGGGFVRNHHEGIADAADAVDTAAAVGASCLVVITGDRANHTHRNAWRLARDAVRKTADRAGERGVHVAVHPMHRDFALGHTFLTELAVAADFVDSCGHPAVGLVLDLFHLFREAEFVRRIRDVASLTTLVAVSDGPERPRHDHDRKLPGEGDVPLEQILAALAAAGYAGPFELQLIAEEIWQREPAVMLEDAVRATVDLWASATGADPAETRL